MEQRLENIYYCFAFCLYPMMYCLDQVAKHFQDNPATEDIQSIQHGFSSRQLRINRMVRWCEEAYDQRALLTQLDLAVLLNVCDAVVSNYVNEYQRASGRILPTRGNIHDMSGAITHKREIITLYLQGCLTPTIARKTRHSKDAVDRYIRDYEAVKLVRTATADIDKIS